MAKLNGVKTVDMINGEITKISHKGAEYARIANNFKDAQTDDLFLSGGGMDKTEGAFYAINYEDRGDGHPIKFVDDAGVKNGYVKEAPYPLFRKISAQTTPTIEERVEELEAEVAQLKAQQSVETIEFEGEQYRKVDRKAQAGDVFVIKHNDGRLPEWFTVGKKYKAYEYEGDVMVIADDNDDLSVYSDIHGRTTETVGVYEPIVKAESKPKLKAGDFVNFEKGDMWIDANKPYEVFASESGKLYILDDEGDASFVAIREYKYEILSAEEVAKHRGYEKWATIGRKPGEFKRGDIVRVLAHKHGRKIGEIGVVENPGTVRIGIRFGDRQFVAITESNEKAELITPVDARFDK